MKKERFVITIPPFLKKRLELYAQHNECSQAEVLRMALVRFLEAEHEP